MAEKDRWWVNDAYGIYLNGKVTYLDSPPQPVKNFVGIVDEESGGMVAYASPEVAERIVDALNKVENLKRNGVDLL
jgi:hypothetical protein